MAEGVEVEYAAPMEATYAEADDGALRAPGANSWAEGATGEEENYYSTVYKSAGRFHPSFIMCIFRQSNHSKSANEYITQTKANKLKFSLLNVHVYTRVGQKVLIIP